MRIDNDFLTLLDLTVRIERVHQMTMVGRPVAEQMRLSEEIDRMKMDRDALVAKINAADHACLSQIEKAMGRPAGDDRDLIIATLRNELKHSRATIDAITADLEKREARMVEAKDAASICAAKLCDIAELLVDAANALIAVIPNEEDGE